MPREPSTHPGFNPSGTCLCGCGERTPLATKTNLKNQLVKDRPTRFCPGHAQRLKASAPKPSPTTYGDRQCTRCTKVQPVIDFAVHSGGRDGRRAICKNCQRLAEHARLEAMGEDARKEYRRLNAQKSRSANPLNRRFAAFKWMCKAKGAPLSDGDSDAARGLYALPCAYCGVQPSNGIDHKLALSRHGTSALENLAPCCFACNTAKKARTPEEYRSSLHRL